MFTFRVAFQEKLQVVALPFYLLALCLQVDTSPNKLKSPTLTTSLNIFPSFLHDGVVTKGVISQQQIQKSFGISLVQLLSHDRDTPSWQFTALGIGCCQVLICWDGGQYLWPFGVDLADVLNVESPEKTLGLDSDILLCHCCEIQLYQFLSIHFFLYGQIKILMNSIINSDQSQCKSQLQKRSYFILQMSVVLGCCSNDQPYLGMDPDCTQDALICLQHSPHANTKGIFHNIIPVAQFKTTINQMKYQMADKVGTLTDQYSQFMDQLADEIQSLKIRKVTELGTLWLRELASTEEEYEQLKRIFRNDLSGFCCKEIHSFYRKVTQTQDLQKQSLQKIPAYSEICKVMNGLTSSPRARMLITQKITNLEGILQKGQLLKRALPDRKLFKQNTKEILLEAANPKHFDIRYNRVELKTSSSNYQSIFSKYPLLAQTNYHLLINCKYTNIILGVCQGEIKNKTSEKADLHYNQYSLTYNCSNGCIYRDGMFESGTTNLTKGQKELQLVLHVTKTEMILLIGSKVICRASLQATGSPVYLHLLMRTLGDSVEIDRDQGQFANFSSQIDATDAGQAKRDGRLGPSPSLADYLRSTKKQTPVINESGYEFQKDAKKVKFQPELIESRPTFGNHSQNLMQSSPVYESVLEPKINGQLFESIEQRLPVLPLFARNDKSSVIINMDSSVYGSDPNSQKYNAGSEVYKRGERDKLLSPVEIKLEKSQFQSELRSNNYLSNLQSIKLTSKDISGLDGLRKTENDQEWL